MERRGTKKQAESLARYGIVAKGVYGVSVGDLRKYAKELGRNHALALELWATGAYEPRMLATFIDEPERVTSAQMDRWAKDFDNWAICDSACFHLFVRTPHAWKKVEAWADRPEEFIRRAAFALLASLSAKDREAEEARFSHGLALIEAAATDERNFVKKGVNWALRCIGKRSAGLHAESLEVSARLSRSDAPTARWIGKDALRDLNTRATTARLSKKSASPRKKR